MGVSTQFHSTTGIILSDEALRCRTHELELRAGISTLRCFPHGRSPIVGLLALMSNLFTRNEIGFERHRVSSRNESREIEVLMKVVDGCWLRSSSSIVGGKAVERNLPREPCVDDLRWIETELRIELICRLVLNVNG